MVLQWRPRASTQTVPSCCSLRRPCEGTCEDTEGKNRGARYSTLTRKKADSRPICVSPVCELAGELCISRPDATPRGEDIAERLSAPRLSEEDNAAAVTRRLVGAASGPQPRSANAQIAMRVPSASTLLDAAADDKGLALTAGRPRGSSRQAGLGGEGALDGHFSG